MIRATRGAQDLTDRRLASAAGFTLLELMIALLLFAMLSVLLAGGLRLGTRVWDRVGGMLDQLAEREVVQGFLRRTIASAQPLGGSGKTAAFEGRTGSITFVAPSPPYVGSGGFNVFQIAAEGRREASPRLVLRLWNIDPAGKGKTAESPVAPPSFERVLLRGLQRVSFSFYGASDDGTESWRSRWDKDDLLPRMVRLELVGADGRRWPALLVALRLARVVSASSGPGRLQRGG